MAELVSSGNNGKRSSLKRIQPRVDLTAMVDLAFLLITFFIMATTLQKPKVMELAMPTHDGPKEGWGNSRTMTICLGKDNKVLWYLGMPENPLIKPQLVNYTKTGLRAALLKTEKDVLKTTGKPMIVILKPGPHSKYGNLVNAIDELNIAGVITYAVADILPKDTDMLKQRNAY